MVIKFIESTYDSVKDKLKNPFYGTLFAVWIIRNREFIYNVFFNDDITSNARLEIIRSHFLNWGSLLSFIETIFISLGLMVLIYASLNLSRFIVEFSERKLKPWIQKLFSSTSIVSREDFQVLESERDYFQKKYSEERNERVKLQRELDERVTTLAIDSPKAENSNNEIELSKNVVELMFKNWKDLGIYDRFKNFIGYVNDGVPAGNYEDNFRPIIRELLSMNIIITDKSSVMHYFKFTPYGEKIKEYYLSNYYKE